MLLRAAHYPIRPLKDGVITDFEVTEQMPRHFTRILYAEIVFRPGGPLAQRVEQTFDMTPFYVAALVSTGVLIAVSVLALTTAALQKSSVVVMGEASRRDGS